MSGQEEGRDAGNTRADRNAGPVLAAFVLLRRVGGASGGSVPDAEPGVHPLVDLLADPLDETLGYRAVIVAAKFVVRCRCGCDVLAGTLIHGEKIHLDYRIRPCPDGAQITRVKYRVVTYPVLLTGALSCAATGCQARGGRLVRLAGTVAQAGAAASTAGRGGRVWGAGRGGGGGGESGGAAWGDALPSTRASDEGFSPRDRT